MNRIAQALHHTQERIQRACLRAGRAPDAVQLMAVSKTRSAEEVREAAAAGQRLFGENYVQEGLTKIQALQDLRAIGVRWCLIGPLQSNKTQDVAAHFDAVHSVDRLRIAQRLSDQRPPALPPLEVMLQVNISGEASKSGIAPDALPALARAVASLPRLRLTGLMAIPAPAEGEMAQRQPHAALRSLAEQLAQEGLLLPALSMGMSDDLEAAVLEGSTLVRVGTGIFGARLARP